MAKRCVTQYALEGVSHNFMTFNDFSFLVDNPYYGTNVGNIDSKISSYGDNICSIHLSDSEYLHPIDGTSILWQKELSTSYSGYTNFNMWLNNLNTIVISNGMLTSEVSSRYVYWAIVLDDAEEIGWVVARHVDGNCYVCGGHNDTGALIYYAFMRGVISPSGGAGSGYIGNALVSNKKMVGYNVPTSSAESTKTESVNEASESPVSGKPKIGNGYAKIKLLREPVQKTIEQIVKNADFANHYKLSSYTGAGVGLPNEMSDLSQYYNTDWTLEAQYQGDGSITFENGVLKSYTGSGDWWQLIVVPLNGTYTVTGVDMDFKIGSKYDGWDGMQFFLAKCENGHILFTDGTDGFICAAKRPCNFGSASTRFFCEIPANSNDFNHIEANMEGPVSGINYIAFAIMKQEQEIKNIKLTVLEE